MSRPIQPIHIARCPCHDCSLTAPICGSFAASAPVPGSGFLTYSHKLEGHRLPIHLKSYDIPSPRLNSVLQVQKGSLVEAILNYVRYTAATIFHDWATNDEELVGTGVGTFIGAQQHLALALVREAMIDWEGAWSGIWKPGSAHLSVPGGANEAAYRARLLAADAAVELMLRGFPRLDVCTPHRIQVFGQRIYNRQGYCLRIHHTRVPPGWRKQNPGDTSTFYDTTEISPVAVQEALVRLKLPRDTVKLLGDREELGFLGSLRLAHELVLNEWANETRSLHFSRLGYPPQEGQFVGLPWLSTAEDQSRNTQGPNEGQQYLSLDIELQELSRYFKVIRTIQEVFVLNELVVQCAKPAGSSAALAHIARINEYTDSINNSSDSSSIPHTEGIPQKESANKSRKRKRHGTPTKAFSIAAHSNLYQDIMKNSWKIKGSSESRALGKKDFITTIAHHTSIKIIRNDPALCTEPWWVAGVPALGVPDTAMVPQNATSTERSFVEQSVQQRAQKAGELETKNASNAKVRSFLDDSQMQKVQSPPYRPSLEQSLTDRSSLPGRKLHAGQQVQAFQPTGNPVLQPQSATQLRMPQYPQLTAVHGKLSELSPEAEYLGQFVDTCTDLVSLYSTAGHGHAMENSAGNRHGATTTLARLSPGLYGHPDSHTVPQLQWPSMSDGIRVTSLSTTANIACADSTTLPLPPLSSWDSKHHQQQQQTYRRDLNFHTEFQVQPDYSQLSSNLRLRPRGSHGQLAVEQ